MEILNKPWLIKPQNNL